MNCNNCGKRMSESIRIIGPLESNPEAPDTVCVFRCDDCNVEVEI